MLRVDNLKIDPLPPLSFAVANGECLAIEGPSGSGKTRLLRAIADLDPSDGQVFLDGAERNEFRGPQWRRRVRFVSAEPAWWTDTPRETFELLQRGNADKLSRCMAALALKEKMLDAPLSSLSTGERQRLALIRAVIEEPPVLLLDEPASSLDPGSAGLVEDLIRQQVAAGRCIILVSHDTAQIGRLTHASLQLARPSPVRGRPAP